jgi:hypothetical protein
MRWLKRQGVLHWSEYRKVNRLAGLLSPGVKSSVRDGRAWQGESVLRIKAVEHHEAD